MKQIKLIGIWVLLFGLFSCNKIERKSKQLVNKTRNFTSRQIDKVFPSYDSYKVDTENNKRRFKEHIDVKLTPDVKNIYAYGDFMGADFSVAIAFNCDSNTVNRIIQSHKMKPATENLGGIFPDNLSWWDIKDKQNLKFYKFEKPDEYYEYLWFDTSAKKAYYNEFSM
ncbi:MAG: hypothetical protein ACXWEY_06660 [Bacteroidia bacterium]